MSGAARTTATLGFQRPQVVPALCLAAVAAFLAWAYIIGRNAQTTAVVAERPEIALEDDALCVGLGFAEHDDTYRRCMAGLLDIRRKQKERWDAANL